MAASPLTRSELGEQFIGGAQLTHTIAQSLVAQLPEQSNLDATSSPTVNDDSGLGYAVGSLWIDVNSGKIYLCIGSQIGSAEWIALGLFTATDESKLDLMRVFSVSDEDKLDNIVFPAVDTSVRVPSTITSNSTLTLVNDWVLVDASGGAVIITLPGPSELTGKSYDITKIDSSTNTVTVSGSGTVPLTAVIEVQDESITVASDGSSWRIL